MFTKGNKIYSDAGCYLKSNTLGMGFRLPAGADDVEEVAFDLEKMRVENGVIRLGSFAIRPETFDRGGVKTRMIRYHYNNDDQIAVMLNRDNDVNAAAEYERMQQWRKFAGEVARKATLTGTCGPDSL